jgi:hypothetical protein
LCMPLKQFKEWVNRQVALQLDKQRFSSLSLKTRIGLFVLSGSFVIGYGGPVLAMILAGKNGEWAAGIAFGTFFYLFSWIVGAVGIFLAGRDCIKYPLYFFAKLVKFLFRGHFNDDDKA